MLYLSPFGCFFFFLVVPHSMWELISLNRDQTHPPALEAQSLNHWTTRKVPLNALTPVNGHIYFWLMAWTLQEKLHFPTSKHQHNEKEWLNQSPMKARKKEKQRGSYLFIPVPCICAKALRVVGSFMTPSHVLLLKHIQCKTSSKEYRMTWIGQLIKNRSNFRNTAASPASVLSCYMKVHQGVQSHLLTWLIWY